MVAERFVWFSIGWAEDQPRSGDQDPRFGRRPAIHFLGSDGGQGVDVASPLDEECPDVFGGLHRPTEVGIGVPGGTSASELVVRNSRYSWVLVSGSAN